VASLEVRLLTAAALRNPDTSLKIIRTGTGTVSHYSALGRSLPRGAIPYQYCGSGYVSGSGFNADSIGSLDPYP
jgi:hypothetical protein